MVYKKEYTDKQYRKWLYTPFSSSFGVSEDKVLNWFFKRHPPIINRFGLTKSNMKNTYLKLVKKELGSGAYVTFLGILVAEGATGGIGWINNIQRFGSPYQQLKEDLNKMKGAIKHPHSFPINDSAPETGGTRLNKVAYEIYKHLPSGSIGGYYMTFTLAGNACCWANAWARTQYFGNPYDQIIDMIKSLGGKPFNGKNEGGTGGNGGTGLEGLPNLPRAVYLNNSEFTILGVHFKRYKNWLFIHYPFNINGSFSGSDSSSDSGTVSSKVKKEQKIVKSFGSKRFVYEQYRPQRDPNQVGWADCSGLAGWIMHTVYPAMWNHGYINTGTILAYAKAHKLVLWHGSQYEFSRKQIKNIKAGDFFVMGNEPSCGAGNYSHVVFCYEGSGAKAKVISQEGPFGARTTYRWPMTKFVNHWWPYSEHPYFYHCRTK